MAIEKVVTYLITHMHKGVARKTVNISSKVFSLTAKMLSYTIEHKIIHPVPSSRIHISSLRDIFAYILPPKICTSQNTHCLYEHIPTLPSFYT